MKFKIALFCSFAAFPAFGQTVYGPSPSQFQSNGIQFGTANNNICFIGDSITAQVFDVATQTATISGGTGPYTISYTLPAGMTLSYTSPNISVGVGVPLSSGTYTIPITITDSASHVAIINLIVTVPPNFLPAFSGGGTSNGLTLTAPSSVTYAESSYGPGWWAKFGSYGTWQVSTVGEFGLSGDSIEGVQARLSSIVTATSCSAYVVMIGTNDIAVDTTAQMETGLSSIWNTLLATGKPVIAETILPRSLAQAQADQLWAVNQWIRSNKGTKQGLYILDPSIYYGNPSSATAAPATNASYDGLHPNSYGAQLAFTPLVKLLDQLFPYDTGYSVTGNSDIYDSNNPYGNLLTNGMFYGTGGTVGANGTGTVPTNWTAAIFQGYGTTGTISSVYSLATLSDGTNAVQALISGTISNNYESKLYFAQSLATSNVNAGDKLQASCRIELSSGASFMGYPQVVLTYTSNGISYIEESTEPSNGDYTNGLGYSGLLSTPLPALAIPATPSSSLNIYVGLYIYDVGSTSSAVSGSFRVGACAVRKVQ